MNPFASLPGTFAGFVYFEASLSDISQLLDDESCDLKAAHQIKLQ